MLFEYNVTWWHSGVWKWAEAAAVRAMFGFVRCTGWWRKQYTARIKHGKWERTCKFESQLLIWMLCSHLIQFPSPRMHLNPIHTHSRGLSNRLRLANKQCVLAKLFMEKAKKKKKRKDILAVSNLFLVLGFEDCLRQITVYGSQFGWK